MMQFRARGLTATQGRTGVLLYLDEAEHVAEVIADEAVFTRVAADEWAETIAALVAGIKAGRAADGLVTAIGRAGAVLAAHLPVQAGDVNELPDALIEI
jgi:putative membrane protein